MHGGTPSLLVCDVKIRLDVSCYLIRRQSTISIISELPLGSLSELPCLMVGGKTSVEITRIPLDPCARLISSLSSDSAPYRLSTLDELSRTLKLPRLPFAFPHKKRVSPTRRFKRFPREGMTSFKAQRFSCFSMKDINTTVQD